MKISIVNSTLCLQPETEQEKIQLSEIRDNYKTDYSIGAAIQNNKILQINFFVPKREFLKEIWQFYKDNH